MKEHPKYPSVLHAESGEYPSEESLEFIKTFDVAKYGCLALAEFTERIWWASDWGYYMKGKRIKKLYLSTGGWSGNEDIMSALKENYLFWSLCWQRTRRGGHYEFRIEFRNQ